MTVLGPMLCWFEAHIAKTWFSIQRLCSVVSSFFLFVFYIWTWRPKRQHTGGIYSTCEGLTVTKRQAIVSCGLLVKNVPNAANGTGSPGLWKNKSRAAHLTLVCRLTYRLWKLFVFSIWPALGPCSLWMISAFISMAMWAGSRDSRSRSWDRCGGKTDISND